MDSVRLAGALLILLVIGLGGWMLVQTREAEIREASQSLGNETVILGEDVDQVVSSADAFLSTAARQLRFDEAGRLTNDVQMRSLLAEWNEKLPLVASFVIATADGRRWVDTRVKADGPLPGAMTTHSFAWARDDRSLKLGIVGPGRTAVGDRSYVLSLVRRVQDDQGRFLGLVAEVINLESLAKYFSQIDLGRASAINLFRRNDDGTYTLLARYPFNSQDLGSDLKSIGRGDPRIRWQSSAPGVDIGRFTFADNVERMFAARDLRGYPLALTLGRPWSDVIRPWHGQAALIVAVMIVLIGLIFGVIVTVMRQVEARIAIERQAGAALASQRRAELEVQSSKLDALARLAGGVAHEFNNLLQPIKTLSDLGRQLAKDASAPQPRLVQYFERIHDGARTASAIAADFLTFCGTNKRPVQRRNLSRAVGDAIEKVRPLIAAPDELELDAEPDVEAGFDELGLVQIVINLVKNAIEARAAGPRVGVKIHISVRHAPDGGALLEVFDNGPGMNDAVRARVFEPFFTTKGPTGGTGLGLAVAYGIVTTWGGQIAVDSHPGRGAKFTITLSPASQPPEVRDVARSPAA